MPRCSFLFLPVLAMLLALLPAALFAADAPPEYAQVAPIFSKYCGGCHNADERDGKLSLETYEHLQQGGESGPAVVPGSAAASRLIRVLTGQAQPAMPPEDEPAPKEDEIALLRAWIDAGAKGPEGSEFDRTKLLTPRIEPRHGAKSPITAAAWRGEVAAVARYGEVGLLAANKLAPLRTIRDFPGKVNSLVFSADGRQLVAASGIAGLHGVAALYNAEDAVPLRSFAGHRDIVYAAVLSPDGKRLATAGYDRKIVLWDAASGEQLRVLDGHNDAIYDLAFSPDGMLLASASGDHTGKIWSVASGERLDTLSQPQGEQYTIAFSPDGSRVLAGGVDNRIRVWQVESRSRQQINPLLLARYAHEEAIVCLAFTPDGKTLVSASEDRTIKLWETAGYTQTHVFEAQPDVPAALAVSPDGRTLLVGRMDGTLQTYPIPAASGAPPTLPPADLPAARLSGDEAPAAIPTIAEQEPNDTPQQAMPVELPVTITGVIHAEDRGTDADLFRFEAKAGQQWILEVNAARSGSPLDSKIEVLDAEGRPIPRVLLQAVRDSYLTFRGVDSRQRQFRLHNWEEMEQEQYLYVNGEVTRLYLPPRGPDSGFEMYPHGGDRHGYFDTTALAHPLHQPAYIVEPHPPGSDPPPNGLPVFTIYYENDDESRRRFGADSRLTFTAPADGVYLARVTDVRGFQGESYKYSLTIRPPRPDFSVRLEGANPTVAAGSGKEFSVVLDRIDGFEGAVRVDIDGLPPGFSAAAPLVIQAGHSIARGTINALPEAPLPTAENAQASRVTATAEVGGRSVTKDVNNFGEIRLEGRPRIVVHLSPSEESLPEMPRRTWSVLKPASAESAAGAKLEVAEDGSVLAGGDNPAGDSYTLVLETDLENIHALRLEPLAHDSLPAKGPGRAANGNFLVTGVRWLAAPRETPDQQRGIEVARVWSYFSQSGHDVAGLVDGKDDTGWAIAHKEKDKMRVKPLTCDPAHHATFDLAEPLAHAGGIRLVVTIDQKSASARHNLGRFRLLASGDPLPPLALPTPPEITVAPGQTITARLRIERRGFDGRVPFESLNLNLPQGVIIDNVGLNGVLIPEGQTERTIFLTAARWVPETTRSFYMKATEDGSQTSWPMILHVRKPKEK